MILKLLMPKRKISVQAYGKLPYTNSFIAVSKSNNALVWQRWLYTQNLTQLTDEMKPFIFQASFRSPLIVGLIAKSCDGSAREFPFSIFVDWKKKWSFKKNLMNDFMDIWEELLCIYKQKEIDNLDFDQFYLNLFQSKVIIQSKKNKTTAENDIMINIVDLYQKKIKRPLFYY
ncbi:Type VI secretion system-associated [Candidatus Magnetomorum sp. HK-1]|nr:Type VI secretion system-associated [Candidatus Magnetomorum sp. HK-1]